MNKKSTQHSNSTGGKSQRKTWVYWIVSCGGLGSVPKASGTVGTLVALPIWYAFSTVSHYGYLIGSILAIFAAIYVSQLYEDQKGSHDSAEIVIDEVVGFLISMTWLPRTLPMAAFGFLIFRVFDIFKPGPIGMIDRRMKGGAGVVMDDVAAGIFTNILLHAAIQIGYLH